MKKFSSNIVIQFGGNFTTAKNKQEYVQKVKDSIYNEFGIELQDNEITDIKYEGEV